MNQVTLPGDYTITRVQDEVDLLHYLEKNGLSIGSTFELTALDYFAHTHTIAYAGQSLDIPESIAKKIYVE